MIPHAIIYYGSIALLFAIGIPMERMRARKKRKARWVDARSLGEVKPISYYIMDEERPSVSGQTKSALAAGGLTKAQNK